MYALNIAEDGRILSATYPLFAPADAVIVDKLPNGDISDYRYINGEFVFDPLPEPIVPDDTDTEATTDDVLNALLGVTE